MPFICTDTVSKTISIYLISNLSLLLLYVVKKLKVMYTQHTTARITLIVTLRVRSKSP